MTAKKDSNKTKREMLIEAWKKRKDYLGVDKGKGSMYNSWRSKVFTNKGKTIGYPDKWRLFIGFKEDMEEGWFQGAVLVRYDSHKPYSKDNCYWGNKGEEALNRAITITYNGERKKIVEWCNQYSLNYNGVKARYARRTPETTVEEILFGRKYIRTWGVCRDKAELDKQSRRLKMNKMLSQYRHKDLIKNRVCSLTLDELEMLTDQPCHYCGSTSKIGIDRLNNDLGHSVSNCVPCCYTCNIVKGIEFTESEMKKIGKVIAEINKERHDNNK